MPPGVGAGRSPLAGAGRSPAHLADRVGGALPAVSQHLAKLKLAGLVRSRREGRRQVYYVDDPDIVTVVRVMVGQLTARETPSGTPPRLREAGV
ncbi:metalloregulator ArsR/SmtB family transcription factor [Streptomyces sp. SAI-041]|uniref:ArsR/SmtB family transcription factor n=1 Tax=unclassified Streptomyces TaxID=2593676 RepID=UPI002475BC07|nr:metalloregulator ArsR/SmtB family transcription factor [Streptomyces sp. SAI-041]